MAISKLVNTWTEVGGMTRTQAVSSASCSGGVRVRQQLQTGVFSSQMIERMRGDKNWTWTPVGMHQRVQPRGKVLSPVNIQLPLSPRASAWHPQDKALHFLPPSALSSSSSQTSISSPLSHILRVHEPPLLSLVSLNVTSSLTVSVLLAASPQICVCGVFCCKLAFWVCAIIWRRLSQDWYYRDISGESRCAGWRGDLSGQRSAAGLNPTRPVYAADKTQLKTDATAHMCSQRRCVLVKWAKPVGRPHMQMLLCVVSLVSTLLSSPFPENASVWIRWPMKRLCLLQPGRINAEEEVSTKN